jgi:hypothetical protein
LFVNASGNVGVATSSPGAAFHVAGTITSTPTGSGLLAGLNSNYSQVKLYGTTGGLLDFGASGADATARIRVDNANGDLQFHTGSSSEKVRITAAGLVGVGTSSPSAKLEIKNDVSATTSLDTTAIKLYNDLDGGSGIEFSNAVAGKSKISFGVESSGGGTNDTYLGFSTCLNASALAERLRIDSSGRVGIGTTVPGEKLDVFGVIRATNTSDSSFYSTFSNPDGLTRIRAYGGGSSICFDLGTSEKARIDSSGRLLVGTSTARSNFYNTTFTSLFQVENANGTRLTSFTYGEASNAGPIHVLAKHRSASVGGTTVVAADDNIGTLSFQGSDGTEFVACAEITAQVDGTPGANDMPGRLVFSTTADGAATPTERMRIGNSGTVTFNTGKTIIYETGDIQTSVTNNASANGFILDTGDGGSGDRPKFRICYGSADQIFLDGNGTAQKPGGGSWAATSDLRSKEDIVDYTSGLDQLKQIQPRSYRYIGNENTYIGLVAQEVEDAMPELVKLGEGTLPDGTEVTDFRTLDQTPLTFALINAVKEMAATIEILEAKVAALEGA